MLNQFLKSKIHRATVTDADINYEGSISIDPDLVEAAQIGIYEKVLIVDINNGSRFETYVIEGKRGSGEICINGAAARLVSIGDLVIIMAFSYLHPDEAKTHKPVILAVDHKNQILASSLKKE